MIGRFTEPLLDRRRLSRVLVLGKLARTVVVVAAAVALAVTGPIGLVFFLAALTAALGPENS